MDLSSSSSVYTSFSSLSKTPPSFSLSSSSSSRQNSLQLLLLRSHLPQRALFLRNPILPPPFSRQNRLPLSPVRVSNQSENDDGFLLEDVPHLTNFLPNLPVLFFLLLHFFLFTLFFNDTNTRHNKNLKKWMCWCHWDMSSDTPPEVLESYFPNNDTSSVSLGVMFEFYTLLRKLLGVLILMVKCFTI